MLTFLIVTAMKNEKAINFIYTILSGFILERFVNKNSSWKTQCITIIIGLFIIIILYFLLVKCNPVFVLLYFLFTPFILFYGNRNKINQLYTALISN